MSATKKPVAPKSKTKNAKEPKRSKPRSRMERKEKRIAVVSMSDNKRSLKLNVGTAEEGFIFAVLSVKGVHMLQAQLAMGLNLLAEEEAARVAREGEKR